LVYVILQDVETPTMAAAADDKEFSVSHPLQNEWTLWFDSPASQAKPGTWMDNLYKICTFGTVRSEKRALAMPSQEPCMLTGRLPLALPPPDF